MSGKSGSRPTNKLIGLLLLLLLVVALSFLAIRWFTSERQPLPEATEALGSDVLVQVAQEPWLVFAPARNTPDTGFIFYPGGRIDPRGYAPLMKRRSR